MATGSRYVNPYAFAYTPTLGPIPGATLTFYLTGSSTEATTYTDAALTTPNENPVPADATGTFPNIFLDPAVIYKAVLQYPANGVIPGAVIYTADPAETVPQSTATVPPALTANGGAALIGSATGTTVEQRLDALDTEAQNAITALATKAAAASIGSMLGSIAITATGALAAANVGYLVELSSATAATLTLPAEVAGNSNSFVNNGAGAWTITAPSGGFLGGGITGLPSSIQLSKGAAVTVTFDGTNWVLAASMPTFVSNAYGVAIGFPLGGHTIWLQFVSVGAIGSSSSAVATYPVAFTTIVYGAAASKQASSSVNDGINVGFTGLSSAMVYNGGTATGGGTIIIIGY